MGPWLSSVLVIRKESDQVALEERKAKRTEQVFEFKVQLRGVKPPIWRRIQVGPRPAGKLQAGITVEAVESF